MNKKYAFKIGIDWGQINCFATILDYKNKIKSFIDFKAETEQIIAIHSACNRNIQRHYAYLLYQEVIALIELKQAKLIWINIEKGLLGSYAVPSAITYGVFIGRLVELIYENGFSHIVLIDDNIWPIQWRQFNDLPIIKNKGKNGRFISVKKQITDIFNKTVEIPDIDIYNAEITFKTPLKSTKHSHIVDSYYIAKFERK